MSEKKDLVLGQDDFWKNIPDLQYKIKKQPEMFVKEVVICIEKFKEQYAKVIESPASKNENFIEISLLLAHVIILIVSSHILTKVAEYYKNDLEFFHLYLIDLLEKYASLLNPLILLKSVFCMIILRNKNLISPLKSVSLFMKLFQIKHKELRKIMIAHMINDIKRINVHHKNANINKQIQHLIFEIIKNNPDNSAKRALHIMIELYKKNIWNDMKTVNIIALGCLSPYYKVKLIACRFLIETTEHVDEVSSDEEDEITDVSQLRQKIGSKKTKAKIHKFEKQKKKAIRKIKKKSQINRNPNFFPIDLINNPQDFIEKMFSSLKKANDKFEVKLAMMSVISRVIGRHNLFLMNYYSFLQKYCYPHQNEIGKILVYIAEAVHPLIPAEELQPLVKHIIDNFVNDRCAEDKMCMGLNVLREMCIKNHLIMDEFHLNYLAEYRDYRNKNVSSAAKSIINLFREINPKLLNKKYQGRRLEEAMETQGAEKFGEDKVAETIEGAEALGETQSGVPVCCDKILNDADLKKIRQQKQKTRMEKENLLYGRLTNEDQDEDEEEDEGEEIEGEEIEDLNDEDFEEIEENEEDYEDIDEDLEEDGENENKNNVKKKKDNRNKKGQKKQGKSLKEEDDDDFEESEEENPHGFLHEQNITFYKKRGREAKIEKKELMESQIKEKKYHGPKAKGGGTTNLEKNKKKPLMMVRFKKYKQKNRVESVKRKIKKLKVQIGHVRSGKEAARLKKKRLG